MAEDEIQLGEEGGDEHVGGFDISDQELIIVVAEEIDPPTGNSGEATSKSEADGESEKDSE